MKTIAEARTQIAKLRKEINSHNHAYYVLAQPTVTDADYDAIFQELKALEAQWPHLVDSSSPTQRVGSPVASSFPKVQHQQKMLSLDNAYGVGDVLSFFSGLRATGIVEPKIDGLSLCVRYVNGKMVQAITRGDGSTGDDVTANARVIASIPLELQRPLTVEVRGEVCMFFSVFAQLNEALKAAGEDQFANPRNAAAGTMKSKDSRVVASRKLSFVAYNAAVPEKFLDDVASIDKMEIEHTHDSVLKCLVKEGFLTVYNYQSSIQNTLRAHFCPDMTDETFVKAAVAWGEEMRAFAPFPTDGLVFKIDVLKLHAELGEGTRFPKWAVAYKFPPERKATTMLKVEVSIGRHGTMTPVAVLEPVHLSGTTVQRASLCNQDEVIRLGIHEGDSVYVEKSAEIIPKVMGLHRKGELIGSWRMPIKCPSCGTDIVKDPGKVAYYCPNFAGCEAQIVERLKHALGKGALDWDGMGEAQIQKLVQVGIRGLLDLMAVYDEDLGTALQDVLGKAAIKKLLSERERVKTTALWRKIHALGIEGLGRSLSQDLCARWNSLDDMLDHASDAQVLLGDVVWRNFQAGLTAQAEEIVGLVECGYLFQEEASAIGVLSGKVFCITGNMATGKREEVAARIEKAGGMTKSSVSKKVNFLVVGPGGGANKADAAKKHGTAIISEEQLYEMLGEPMPKPTVNMLTVREGED